MKVGVIGSRSFKDYLLLEKTLNKLEISTIISGGAIGADTLAEFYANKHGIEKLIFKPDWSIGKSAAAIRNYKIVENSDIIVAFWDGVSKGTKMTIKMAESKNIKVLKIIYN
jgi:hypothetical protein